MEFHLMIVDDEAPIRKGLSHFIDWASIDCRVDVTASDGMEAIEKLSDHDIDIIITDIKMPEADGIAIAKYVYENYPQIMVIILTGYADFSYAQTAIQYNVTDFLLKPTSKDQLLQSVKKAQEKILTSKRRNTMAEEELAFLKDQLLQELTASPQKKNLVDRLSGYGILLESYYIAAFELTDPEGNLNLLRELINKQNHNSYCYRYNNLILTVYSEKKSAAGVPQTILAHCRDILGFASSLCALDICVGISQHHKGGQEFPVAVSEAIFSLTLNFYSGESISCYVDDISPQPYIMTAEDTLGLYHIEEYLNNWLFHEASAEASSMFMRLTSNLAKSVDVKNICSQIYYICCRVLMKKELSPPSTDYLTRIQHSSAIRQLEDIIDELLRDLEERLTTSGKKYSPMIESAIQYIHQNLSSLLSLEILSAYIHVNPSHLSRTFKKECGQSITDYINQARVEKAKELLALPNTLTYEVAEQAGFNDPAYFSATFKKYTGLSPKEFRQKKSSSHEIS